MSINKTKTKTSTTRTIACSTLGMWFSSITSQVLKACLHETLSIWYSPASFYLLLFLSSTQKVGLTITS